MKARPLISEEAMAAWRDAYALKADIAERERAAANLRKLPDCLPRSQMDEAVEGLSALFILPRLRRQLKDLK